MGKIQKCSSPIFFYEMIRPCFFLLSQRERFFFCMRYNAKYFPWYHRFVKSHTT